MSSIRHATQDTALGISDVLEDSDRGVRIQISRSGAEMFSLAKRDGRENWRGFLHRDGETEAPAEGWANHATVMGYFIHRLRDERSTYEGHAIHSGNHGFLRHVAFEAPEVDLHAGELRYRVAPESVPSSAYPYRVGLTLTYRLSAQGVTVEFHFENTEAHPVSLSFGLHPGFAISSLRNFHLSATPGRYLRQMAPGNFLNGETTPLDVGTGEFPIDRQALPDSYIFDLSQVNGSRWTLQDPLLGQGVELDFSEVPYATLWSSGENFLCIEPCWGLPDSNPPTTFENKPGIQKIPAAGSLTKKFTIHPFFTL